MNYVMSDIHGKYDKFLEMLELISFDDNDTLYILGDIIDRGEEPIKLIQHIMSSKNIKMCLGNHEDMMIQSYYEGITEDNIEYVAEYINRISRDLDVECFNISNVFGIANWINNGGYVTAKQFMKLSIEKQKEIISFFEKLPLFFEYENYILSHAGVNLKDLKGELNIKWDDVKHLQTKDDFIWPKKDFYRFRGLSDKLIIFGHTPGLNSDFSIWLDPKYKDKICMDCGVNYSGKLGCMCLDNYQMYYV